MSDELTQLVPECLVCGHEGEILYPGMRDMFYPNEGIFSSLQCPACGFIWLSPRPVPEDMGRFYHEYFTHAAETSGLPAAGGKRFAGGLRDLLRKSILCGYYGYGTGREPKLLLAVGKYLGRVNFLRERAVNDFQALPVCREGGLVVDVGCGNGDLLFQLKQLGWEVIGIETDPLAAETARRRGLRVESKPLGEAGLPDGLADVVIINHVIEHLYDPVSSLKECRRILKNGGRLTLYTPNALSLGRAVFGRVWRAMDPPRHLYIFSPDTIRAVLAFAGFSQVKIRTSARSAAGVYNASAALKAGDGGGGAAPGRRKGAAAFALKEFALCAMGFPKGEEMEVSAIK